MGQTAAEIFGLTNDSQWLDILIRSVNEPIINGVEMPRFPHGATQRQWVGVHDEAAIRAAFEFYVKLKAEAANLGRPLSREMKFLDFGGGWGRISRLFWNDFPPENISSADVDPLILATCRHLGVPGNHVQIDPWGRLPFDDGTFDVIIAFSVFSHLPERIADHWMAELSRVAKPGGLLAYTTEGRRLIDYIATVSDDHELERLRLLAAFKPQVPEFQRRFDEGQFVFFPVFGGFHRDTDVYGDTCVPETYVRNVWGKYFRLIEYLDDVTQFWQIFVLAQKG